MATPARARKVWQVEQVARALERLLEDTPSLWVRGELVNLSRGRDGRMLWFRLEDAREGVDARLDCFCYATELARGFTPADGVVVEANGRLQLFRNDGSVKLRLTHVEPAGEGELVREILERGRRLAAEGLFDEARRRPLPFLPRRVGLITARGGAALGDVRTRLEARCPVPVTLVSAAMQGPACAGEVRAALALLDADPRVDVIVIARGGGSLQDLLPFSDEALVRAVAACGTPVVSALGHMRDTTLVCRAADRDAATPTAAVDLVVPDRAALAADLAATGRRLAGAARRRADAAGVQLGLLAGRPCLARPRSLVDPPARDTAELGRALRRGLRTAADRAGTLTAARGERLRRGLRGCGADGARTVAELGGRRRRAGAATGREAAARLAVLGARLAGADPTRPLAAGFALVADPAGRAVTTAAAAARAGDLELAFADGRVPVRVTGSPAP